ncbi:MAG: Veg family protein [Clostridia bacterium]|nr:Veg family protein [Clostridia bacterium]
MAAKKVLAEIRHDLEACIGKKVRLQANRGRKKVMERVGVLEQTYPHIFVIKLDEKGNAARRISFSYIDVLTETVKLFPYREDEN